MNSPFKNFIKRWQAIVTWGFVWMLLVSLLAEQLVPDEGVLVGEGDQLLARLIHATHWINNKGFKELPSEKKDLQANLNYPCPFPKQQQLKQRLAVNFILKEPSMLGSSTLSPREWEWGGEGKGGRKSNLKAALLLLFTAAQQTDMGSGRHFNV